MYAKNGSTNIIAMTWYSLDMDFGCSILKDKIFSS
jgi:hypothetical protein